MIPTDHLQSPVSTFHLGPGDIGAGLVLERDPGGDGAALQAGHRRPAGPAAEVVREELRSLNWTSDGGGVHPEESVQRSVPGDGPTERGQLRLRARGAGES